MKTRTMTAGAAALMAAFHAAPAAAQDEGRYFDGPYVSVFGSLGVPADSSTDGFVFDTDGDGAYDDTVATTSGADAFSPGFCRGNPDGSRTPACGNSETDFGYGVRIGLDKRLGDGPVVVGLLLEGSRPGVKEYTTGYSTTPASYTIERELDWALAARARLGIAPGEGRGLFYATGGIGYAQIDRNFFTTNGANSFTPNEGDEWTFGWQAGGGAELMLSRNIGLGLEYLYSRYNDDDYTVTVGQGTAPATNPFLLDSGSTDLKLSSERFDNHSFRASLNFRF